MTYEVIVLDGRRQQLFDAPDVETAKTWADAAYPGFLGWPCEDYGMMRAWRCPMDHRDDRPSNGTAWISGSPVRYRQSVTIAEVPDAR